MTRIEHPQRLQDANWQTAVRANNQIALYAGELSNHFLSGTFLSLFHVERSCELAEPELFTVDAAPNRLETRRMTAAHWLYFAQSLLNEELLASRSVAEQEYEFVLIIDTSRSLTAGWFDALANGTWEQDPCYRLKYLSYALLVSAFREGFKCRIVLFDQGGTQQWETKDDPTFAFAVLERIDELILERRTPPEHLWPWEAALRELIDRPNQLLACVVSDFLDPVQGHVEQEPFVSLLTELRYANRLLVLQVNHRRDLMLSVGGEGLSTFDLHYGEDGDHRGLSAAAIQQRRLTLRNWLGSLEAGAGQFGQRMAEERIPYQRFLSGTHVNQRFEELAYLILQE